MTTVTIVAVSLAALGAFVWSLIPIEEVTTRREPQAPAEQPGGHRAAARARLLASTLARTGRPAVDGVLEGVRSARRRAGTALERAGAAGGTLRERAETAGGTLRERAGTAGRSLRERAGTAGRSLRERNAARERAPRRPRFEHAHDVTGPAPLREDYLPTAEAEPPSSRALAALELILLVVLLGGLIAVTVLGGAELLRHAFRRLGG